MITHQQGKFNISPFPYEYIFLGNVRQRRRRISGSPILRKPCSEPVILWKNWWILLTQIIARILVMYPTLGLLPAGYL